MQQELERSDHISIALAYSEDSDDAFMLLPLKEQLISSSPFQFQFVARDIQELNEAAVHGLYDISAISIAVYPKIAASYYLMTVGSSIGQKFGPAVIVSASSSIADLSELAQKRIAVPGLDTSAFHAASVLFPDFQPVVLRFDQIAGAVLDGTVDGGILIHELQLTCESQGFRKLADLGTLWFRRYGLPLPLGGVVIRKSLGQGVIEDLVNLYRQSIEYALHHRDSLLAAAATASKIKLSDQEALSYIEMYVNQDSLSLQEDVVKGIDLLLSAKDPADQNPGTSLVKISKSIWGCL